MPATSRDPVTQGFSDLRKRSAIRRYLSVLPRQLIDDYGHRGPYTTVQVLASIHRAKLSCEFADYAQAIFCDVEELLLRHPARDHYDELRRELAWRYFGGGPRFTHLHVTRYIRLHGGERYPSYFGDAPVSIGG